MNGGGGLVGLWGVEVVGLFVVVKSQGVGVSPFAEEVDNPGLLFGIEFAFALVVAVVGSVLAQITFDKVAQGRFVLCLNIGEEGLESPGGHDASDGVEAFTAIGSASVGEDGNAFVYAPLEAFACLKVEAGLGLWTILLEAAAVGRWNLF